MIEKYKTILNILSELNDNSIGVEIGVLRGDWSDYMLSNTNIKKIYQIDPWKKFLKEEFVDSINNASQKEFDNMYEEVKNRLEKKYRDRCEILRGVSENFKEKFKNESVDFAYIDGNHMYKEAKKDIEFWYPRVKKNGYLMGDDLVEDGFHIWQKDKDGNPLYYGEYGVKKAISEFCKENKLKYTNLGHGQWSIKK